MEISFEGSSVFWNHTLWGRSPSGVWFQKTLLPEKDIFIFHECKVGYLDYTTSQNICIISLNLLANYFSLKKKYFYWKKEKIYFENLESGVWKKITLLESGVWIHTPLSRFSTIKYEFLLGWYMGWDGELSNVWYIYLLFVP